MSDQSPAPLTTFSFSLEMDGITNSEWKECSGVDTETELIEYKETTKEGKMITSSTELWEWRKQVEEGSVDEARRNGSVVLYDSTHKEVARWNFISGWPQKITGADLNAGENAVAVEAVTITHEGLVREK
jgi:T4-like virus tail tube protein gp19